MIKAKENKSIIWASGVLIGIVFVTVAVNYIGTMNNWNEKNISGLEISNKQVLNSPYFGGEYICDRNKSLFVDVDGSENNIRNRTVRITMVDKHSGPAIVQNMKIKSVDSDSVSYAYRENVVVLNNDSEATLLINNIKVLKDCKKVDLSSLSKK